MFFFEPGFYSIGKRNPSVKVGVVNLDKVVPDAKPEDYITYFENICDPSDTRFHTLQHDTKAIETEFYVCRVDWWPDGSIMVQVSPEKSSSIFLMLIVLFYRLKTVIKIYYNYYELIQLLVKRPLF